MKNNLNKFFFFYILLSTSLLFSMKNDIKPDDLKKEASRANDICKLFDFKIYKDLTFNVEAEEQRNLGGLKFGQDGNLVISLDPKVLSYPQGAKDFCIAHEIGHIKQIEEDPYFNI